MLSMTMSKVKYNYL